jgi:hypothetical protein
VTQKRLYKARADISSQVSRTCLLFLQLLDAAGNILSNTSGAGVASPTSGFLPIDHAVYVDDPMVATIRLVLQANANALGNQHYIDGVILEEIDPATMEERGRGDLSFVDERSYYKPVDYLDGDTADTAYYTYSWEGTTGASFAKQTPVTDRDFDLCLMEPGQSARSFLEPLIGLTGGRLFCDETRDWRLVDDTYTVAGTIALEEATDVTSSTDVVSMSESIAGVPTSFTGVVIAYEVIDANTRTVTRSYDAAGDASGRVYLKAVDGGYPGTGEAAALLARSATRQRTIPVAALSNLDTTPGMALTLTLDGIDYDAIVSRVTWTWSPTADGMTVTPRDLVEA